MNKEKHIFAVAFQFSDGSLRLYSLIADASDHAVGEAIEWLCGGESENYFDDEDGIVKIAVEIQDELDLENMMEERGWKRPEASE